MLYIHECSYLPVFSNYKYDILSISEKSKLSKQFPEGHYLNEDVGVKTLQDKLASKPLRQFYGDFRISRLQTLQLT